MPEPVEEARTVACADLKEHKCTMDANASKGSKICTAHGKNEDWKTVFAGATAGKISTFVVLTKAAQQDRISLLTRVARCRPALVRCALVSTSDVFSRLAQIEI